MDPNESLLLGIVDQVMRHKTEYPNDEAVIRVTDALITNMGPGQALTLCLEDAAMLAGMGWITFDERRSSAALTPDGIKEAQRIRPIQTPNLLDVLLKTSRSYLFSDGPHCAAGMAVARILPGRDPGGRLAVVVSEGADCAEEWFGRIAVACLSKDYGWPCRTPSVEPGLNGAVVENPRHRSLAVSASIADKVLAILEKRKAYSDAVLVNLSCGDLLEEHAAGLAQEVLDCVARGDWPPLHAGIIVTTRSRMVASVLSGGDPHVVVISDSANHATSLDQWAATPVQPVRPVEARRLTSDLSRRIAAARAHLAKP